MSSTCPAGLHVDLHSEIHGSGPPVVILHGLLGSSRNWRRVARTLRDHFQVICVDLRNHGLSPHHSEMDFTVLSADIAALLRKLDLGRVHLVGHSLGGKIAMCTALASAGRVASVTIVDIAPIRTPNRNAPILAAMLALPLAELRSRAAADDYLVPLIPDGAVRQFVLTNLVQTGQGFHWQPNITALAAASEALSDFPPYDDEDSFPGPALFVYGANSPYGVPAAEARILSLFPNARFASIANAGHWPHTEQPDHFIAVLREFLEAA